MGEIVNIQSKQNLPQATATPGEKELTPSLGKSPRVPPTLVDATAAFTFSRLPREQRIAQTLANIVSKVVRPSLNNAETTTMNDEFFVIVGAELAKYSVKDFAVRYGHLEPNAKA